MWRPPSLPFDEGGGRDRWAPISSQLLLALISQERDNPFVKPKKVVYYSDPLNDDFAGTKISHKALPENFKYVYKDPFSRFFSWFMYWIVAIPLLYLPLKLHFGIKVKGRRNMRSVRNKGVFFYCNHTQIIDAMLIQVYVSGLKKTYIVADQDATSIRGIRYLVQSLGCIPVPETPSEHKKFVDCLRYRIKQKRGISIFPEAHIWPYSTHIRPFKDDSFVYPCELEAPVVPVCVTYRKRKFRKKMAPAVTVHVGKPVYPDMSLDLASRRKKLRDHVYYFMLDTSAEDENEEYIAYVRKPAEGEGEK